MVKRDISSWVAFIVYGDLAEPIPLQVQPQLMSTNLSARFSYEPVEIDYVGEPSVLAVYSSITKARDQVSGHPL